MLFLLRENGKGWNQEVVQRKLVMILFCFLKTGGRYPSHHYSIILYIFIYFVLLLTYSGFYKHKMKMKYILIVKSNRYSV